MKLGAFIGLFFGTVLLLLPAVFWYNHNEVERWLKNPQPPGQLISVGSHNLYTTVKGEGSPTVIILPGMNAFSWGWWGIQDEIAKTTRVVTYDRAGYGWSEAGPEPYSSKQIATELHTLLQRLQIDPPCILVGASMGGVYAKHYAKLYPDDVAGVIFADPSAWDETDLRSKAKQDAVAAQRESRTFNEVFASFGGFRFFGSYFLRMHRIPDSVMPLVLEALSNPEQHKNFQRHFAALYRVDDSHFLKAPEGFPQIPVKVIVQDSDVTVGDAVRYQEIKGDASEKKARQYLQSVRQRQREEYMGLSSDSQWIMAEGSGHNIQHERPDLLMQVIRDMIVAIRK